MGELFELRTRGTTYRVEPTASGSGLQQAGWGPSADVPAPLGPPRLQGFETAEDLAPHEYGVAGTRHALESELLVEHAGGRTGALVRLVGASVLARDAAGDRLRARLADAAGGLEIELGWRTSPEHDVVVRTATVTNRSDAPVVLRRARTGAFNLPLPGGATVDALAGGWCEEYEPIRATLPRGTFSIGSRQGVVSHLWAPVVTVSDPDAPARGCWSVQVASSGSWQLDVHATSRAGWVRVCGGVDDDSPVTLAPGCSFEAPELLGLWAPDADAAARAWHRYQRAELVPDVAAARRPVTYNSWYATGFDIDVAQQVELARQAADLGCEEFVLDDGWFTGRTADVAGLGDWTPDPATFPDGLAPLVDAVHELGMRFGLWVEPEGVNPDSDLFRAHPDWIHRSPDREPVTIRNQHVLDLGRPEVEAWALRTLRGVVRASGVDHLKWDMNRAITDGGHPGDPLGRAWSVSQTQAFHRLLDALRAEFPGLTIEGCSGGGARVAASVLARTDVVWPSDETGPRDRLAIQHGYLSAFPAATMSSWVTHLPGENDTLPAPLAFRFCVAMCGVLGLGSDLRDLTEDDRALARTMIARYRDVRNVVFTGEVHRHGAPRAHGYAVEYADGGRTVLFVFGRPDADGALAEVRLTPRWAKPDAGVGEATGGDAAWRAGELVARIDPDAGAALVVVDGPQPSSAERNAASAR